MHDSLVPRLAESKRVHRESLVTDHDIIRNGTRIFRTIFCTLFNQLYIQCSVCMIFAPDNQRYACYLCSFSCSESSLATPTHN